MNTPSLQLRNGNTVPAVGLGTWKIAKTVVGDLIYDAIKAGVRHLDCACDYGNEIEVGQGIKRALDDGLCNRSDLFITSKLWNTYHRREHVKLAFQKSLQDLGLEYMDLYLIHFPMISQRFVPLETRYPPEWIFDPQAENPRIELDPVPLSETWAAMETLVDEGLVRSIGVANLTAQSMMDLLSYARIPPAMNQVEMHPYLIQQALLDYCTSNGIAVTAFSPLGSGSYIELGGDAGFGVGVLKEPKVLTIAEAVGRTPAQVVLRWGTQRGVAIIPKSSRMERINENFNLFDFELTQEQMDEITSLNINKRFNDPGEFCKGMGGAIPVYA